MTTLRLRWEEERRVVDQETGIVERVKKRRLEGYESLVKVVLVLGAPSVLDSRLYMGQ
jgi:hypothetical protein